jgi:predicted nucleotidyltransferase
MLVNNVNPKVMYRFVEFACRFGSYDLCHEDYKMIALNQKETNSKVEKKVKRVSNAFIYLLHSTNQVIDIELIKTTYFLLVAQRLLNQNAFEIIKHIYMHQDEMSHCRATKLLLHIQKMKLKRKMVFGLLLSSFILMRMSYSPLIFYDSDRKLVKKYLKERNYYSLLEMVTTCEHQVRVTIGQLEKPAVKRSLSEVITTIISVKDMITSDFGVNHIMLYGSLIKNSTHEFSDIDILVDMDEKLICFERNEKMQRLKEYLEEKLTTKVDILDFSYSLRYLETNEMNNTIKLF